MTGAELLTLFARAFSLGVVLTGLGCGAWFAADLWWPSLCRWLGIWGDE